LSDRRFFPLSSIAYRQYANTQCLRGSESSEKSLGANGGSLVIVRASEILDMRFQKFFQARKREARGAGPFGFKQNYNDFKYIRNCNTMLDLPFTRNFLAGQTMLILLHCQHDNSTPDKTHTFQTRNY